MGNSLKREKENSLRKENGKRSKTVGLLPFHIKRYHWALFTKSPKENSTLSKVNVLDRKSTRPSVVECHARVSWRYAKSSRSHPEL